MTTRRMVLRRLSPGVIAVLGAGWLGACRQAPIYQTENAVFPGRGNLRDRALLIRRAAGSLGGWQLQDVRPGLMRGTNTFRGHQMTVDIVFDVRTFSIHYVNSVALDYDGARIHPAYNDRVQEFERAIISQPVA